jgi:hypothetical protein
MMLSLSAALLYGATRSIWWPSHDMTYGSRYPSWLHLVISTFPILASQSHHLHRIQIWQRFTIDGVVPQQRGGHQLPLAPACSPLAPTMPHADPHQLESYTRGRLHHLWGNTKGSFFPCPLPTLMTREPSFAPLVDVDILHHCILVHGGVLCWCRRLGWEPYSQCHVNPTSSFFEKSQAPSFGHSFTVFWSGCGAHPVEQRGSVPQGPPLTQWRGSRLVVATLIRRGWWWMKGEIFRLAHLFFLEYDILLIITNRYKESSGCSPEQNF